MAGGGRRPEPGQSASHVARLAGAGLTLAAVTAVAVQVLENHRAVYGAVAAVLGASWVLRAAGDAGNGALSWLSPIGWGQRTFPFAGDRWWPLLLHLAATVLLVAVALVDRRDFAAGLRPPRPGRASASLALGSPLGLAWRLQRGSVIAWAIGLLLLGLAYGSFADSFDDFVADYPEIAQYLGGDRAGGQQRQRHRQRHVRFPSPTGRSAGTPPPG